ncbi:hypothetical protein [Catellatospora tritici]|uniref:hypothetical protein n=1 Tax=Catellatospora tritici TaxID=2851566 RepID=UPI001C2D36D6|nr:hypothetical protein [Catellatospora tritici]MBV1851820.1 hypothetical protein [Catellatospora tritici]
MESKPVHHWCEMLGGVGIFAGLLTLLIAANEHDGIILGLGGVLLIGGALLRIEAAIRQRNSG